MGKIDKIDVKKATGEIVTAELISFFELTNTNKKYIFYTMNETVENDLVKLYIAEAIIDENGLSTGPKMSEEEWANIKSIMKSILTGNKDPNVKYLDIEGV